MSKIFLAILFLLASVLPVRAVEIGGADLPETMAAGDSSLLLNGAGLRKKTIFRVKVYAGGLYLLRRSSDPAGIINADVPMAVKMVFIYKEVSPKKLINAWNEGFAASGYSTSAAAGIKQFNSFFTEEARRKDIYDLIYLPGAGVTVSRNGAVLGTIAGMEFKKALFSIWLGEKPADSGLKESMLGK